MPFRRSDVATRSARRPAGSWINGFFVLVMRRTRGLKHILPRTGAGIDQRRITQSLPRREINLAPFALDVRRKRPGEVRPFIPLQSKPAKVFDESVTKFPPATISIQIFNSKHQFPTVRLRTFLRAPKSHRVPQMKIARGRWGEAAAVPCHSERSRGICHSPRICMKQHIPRLRFAFTKWSLS